MRKLEVIQIELEEHEIGALEMLSKIECPETSFIPCPKCPFHINVSFRFGQSGHTNCLALLCRDILRKNRKE